MKDFDKFQKELFISYSDIKAHWAATEKHRTLSYRYCREIHKLKDKGGLKNKRRINRIRHKDKIVNKIMDDMWDSKGVTNV